MSFCTRKTVTLKDTLETVDQLPVLGDYHLNDGYDWMSDIEEHGWGAVGLWGHDGYDLGQWPYVIIAVTSTEDTDGGTVYGVAQYTEGDVRCQWFRSKARAWEAITRHAFEHWKLSGSGPENLPELMANLPQEFREPVRIER